MRLNLKANNANEQRVLDYLEANASDVLAEKINTGKKTLKGFFGYASGEARKTAVNGCACVEDKTVFGWAIHYFEEDEIKEATAKEPKVVIKATEAAKSSVKAKKVDKPTTRTDKPQKTEISGKETAKEQQKAKPAVKKTAKKTDEGQMSFFDTAFGGAI